MSIADRIATVHRVAAKATTVLRVAAAALSGKGLGIGQTYQNEKIRVHRYRDQLRVTDLTNAGKKGKACLEFTTFPTYSFEGDRDGWLDRVGGELLHRTKGSNPYAECKGFVADLSKENPGQIYLEERKLKGIEVEPFGEVFQWSGKDGDNAVRGKASPHDAMITFTHTFRGQGADKSKSFDQDHTYSTAKRKDAAIFYAYMKDNFAEVKKITSSGKLIELFNHLGIDYNDH